MSGNEFLLPQDLGWDCNDELQKVVKDWVKKAPEYAKLGTPIKVVTAELIDDMYAVIKKYQKGAHNDKI